MGGWWVAALLTVGGRRAGGEGVVVLNGYGTTSRRLAAELEAVREAGKEEVAALRAELVSSIKTVAAECQGVVKEAVEGVEAVVEKKVGSVLEAVEAVGRSSKAASEQTRVELAEVSSALDAKLASRVAELQDFESKMRSEAVEVLDTKVEAVARHANATDSNVERISSEAAARFEVESGRLNATLERIESVRVESFNVSKQLEELLKTRVDTVEATFESEARTLRSELSDLSKSTSDRFDENEELVNNASAETLVNLTRLWDDVYVFRNWTSNWTADAEAAFFRLDAETRNFSTLIQVQIEDLDARTNRTLIEFKEATASTFAEHAGNVSALASTVNATEYNVQNRLDAIDAELQLNLEEATNFSNEARAWAFSVDAHSKDVDDTLSAFDVRVNSTDNALRNVTEALLTESRLRALELEDVSVRNFRAVSDLKNETLNTLAEVENTTRAEMYRLNQSLLDTVSFEIQVRSNVTTRLNKTLAELVENEIRDVLSTLKTYASNASLELEALRVNMSQVFLKTTHELASNWTANLKMTAEQTFKTASAFSENSTSFLDASVNASLERILLDSSAFRADLNTRLDAHSNATVALEAALNATATAVAHEVEARRRDFDLSKETELKIEAALNASRLEISSNLTSLASETFDNHVHLKDATLSNLTRLRDDLASLLSDSEARAKAALIDSETRLESNLALLRGNLTSVNVSLAEQTDASLQQLLDKTDRVEKSGLELSVVAADRCDLGIAGNRTLLANEARANLTALNATLFAALDARASAFQIGLADLDASMQTKLLDASKTLRADLRADLDAQLQLSQAVLNATLDSFQLALKAILASSNSAGGGGLGTPPP